MQANFHKDPNNDISKQHVQSGKDDARQNLVRVETSKKRRLVEAQGRAT